MKTYTRNVELSFETYDKYKTTTHKIKIDPMMLFEDDFGDKIKEHIKKAKHNHDPFNNESIF